MDWNNLVNVFFDCELVGNKIFVKDRIHDVLDFIVRNYTFNSLREIIAVHCENGNIELIYHLYSILDEEELFISTFVKNEAESVVDIFQSAQADENEIYDLFGVNFKGNVNLKRLYMPSSWKGFPLRKDYVQDDERLCWNDDNNA